MTVIILQVLNQGIYDAVDNTLTATKANITQYVNFHMQRSLSVLEEPPGEHQQGKPSFKPDRNLAANTDIILYTARGEIINQDFAFGQFYDLPLDSSAINQGIIQQPIETYLGKSELYRTLTVEVSNLQYPNVAYATILINTDQLEASNDRSVKIIVTVMIFFWVVSLFASLYLAQWTRRPILESFERQKAFVENASHELRTPLSVLQNRLESLFRHPDETILSHSESIAASLDEVRNMTLLTTNLLNLARRDDGLTPELVELQPSFFEAVFKNYRLIAREQGKEFSGSIALARNFMSDQTLLKQLLTILFDNAIKYTGEDGQVFLHVSQDLGFLVISVADNGPGISDSDKKLIFDRFYRVDKARTRQSGGFGLGLALAKQIVASLNGHLTVRDHHPKGSIFEVRLPI